MYQKLQKTLLMFALLLTGSATAFADITTPQTEDNGKVKYLVGSQGAGFDIHVNYNNQWLQTTFGSKGYHTVLSFDGGATRKGLGFDDSNYWDGGTFQFGKTYTEQGIEVTIVASIPDANTGAVTIKYLVTNTNSTTKTFKLGTYADTQVGGNDKCNVYKEGSQTIVMEDDNVSSPSYGAKYKLTAVTPFTTMWFGRWGGTSGLPTKTFIDAYEFIPNTNTDSAIAWSWDITLEPGESITKIIGGGDNVDIFQRTTEIDLDVPAFLGKDANGLVNGTATDLYEFLQFYLQDSPAPYYIKLRLESNARYVISQPLEVNTAITIEGMDDKYPAIIDASALNGPFVRATNAKAAALTNINDYYMTMYDVTFKNFVLKGLTGSLFSTGGQKFLIPYFNVDNCVVRMTGANAQPVFDFSGSGYVEELSIVNSTLSADDATTWADGGFFNAQGGTTKDDCYALRQILTLKNSTLYNISRGKTTSVLADVSRDHISMTVMNNIIINSGKQGEFVLGLNGGVSGVLPHYCYARMNSFLWTTDNENYVDVGYMETATSPNNVVSDNVVCTDIVGWSGSQPILGITIDKLFSNGNEAVTDGDLSLENCPQKETRIGDPRWLFPSKLEKYITYASLDDDKDLGKTINDFIKEGFSQFVLEDNTQYQIRQPIVTDKSLLIKGNNVIIYANTPDALIQLSETPGVAAINDYYRMNEITLKGLTIDGVKNSLIYDNNVKYCVVNLTIDDCVIRLATENVQNEAIISFKQGGVKDFTIKNSTVYGNNAVAKYFIRYNNAARLDRYGFDKETDFQSMNYENNTFYGLLIADGQWGNYNGISGQNYSMFNVVNNIWYNCGKDIIRRLAGGRFGSDAPLNFNNNTYFNENVCTAESEAQYDNGTILTTDPNFKNPVVGNFTLSAYSEQAQENTGDPRWYKNGCHYLTGIEYVETNDAKAAEKVIYDLQGRRVKNMSKKGVYIVNGKKVITK